MAKVKDPVCGMTIEQTDAVATSEFRGQRYFFCSAACKSRFDASPEEFAGNV